MKTIWRKWWFWLAVVLLIGGIGSGARENEETVAAAANYEIVVDQKDSKIEQRFIRVITEDTDYESITKEIMKKYRATGLDSLHLYIHSPSTDSKHKFGRLKASVDIAYTQRGSAQTDAKRNSYTITVEE